MGERTVKARADDTVPVQADAWHSSWNVGEEVPRHTGIHGAGKMTIAVASE